MNYILRPWTLNDLNDLVSYANNAKIANFMTDAFPHPYKEENGLKFINFAMSGNPVRIFAIEIAAKASGGIGLHPQDDIQRRNAELGYWLAEPFWGKGIITEAVKEIVRFGFANLEIDRIFARPFGSNIASQRVLEKAGFKLEARLEKTFLKNGLKEDELVYAIRK